MATAATNPRPRERLQEPLVYGTSPLTARGDGWPMMPEESGEPGDESEERIRAQAAEFEQILSDFAKENQVSPERQSDLRRWMRKQGRVFAIEDKRSMFLCVRNSQPSTVSVLHVRIKHSLELLPRAAALVSATTTDKATSIGLDVDDDKLGPSACGICKVRRGLGTCSFCVFQAIRDGGVDGLHFWIRALIDYIEGDRHSDKQEDRELLLNWLAGGGD